MSWEYKDNEYVKLFRKLVRWEWYTDINTKVLFIHCLIRANWKDGSWRGINYKRGQFITTKENLGAECGLSRQETRTALNKLLSTNELTTSQHGKKLLITVVNYDLYQGEQPVLQPQNNQSSTSHQPDTNHLATTEQPVSNHRYKNNKNNKELQEEKNIYTASPETDDDFEDYLDNFREMMRYDE